MSEKPEMQGILRVGVKGLGIMLSKWTGTPREPPSRLATESATGTGDRNRLAIPMPARAPGAVEGAFKIVPMPGGSGAPEGSHSPRSSNGEAAIQ